MRWRKIGVTFVVLAAVGGGVAWAFGWIGALAHSPEFVALESKVAAMQALPPEKRFNEMRQMREKVEQLPEQEQRQFHQLARESMHRDMERRLTEYFAAPVEERKALLDKEIDRMRAMQARFAAGGQGP